MKFYCPSAVSLLLKQKSLPSSCFLSALGDWFGCIKNIQSNHFLRKISIAVSVLVCCVFTTKTYSQAIVIDGQFDDWDTIETLFEDVENDNSLSNIDFQTLKVTNDEDWLYIYFEVNTEILLSDNNKIILYLDTDNEISTGITGEGIGSELLFEFGEREGLIRLNNITDDIRHDDIRLVPAPTITSDRFELAISLNSEFFSFDAPLFTNDEIRLALIDDLNTGDRLPDNTGGVLYELKDTSNDFPIEYLIDNNDPNAIRIMSYNVDQDGLFNFFNEFPMDRIFSATQPDIIGFQEIYDFSASATADKIDDFLPDTWFSAKVQPDIICVSRYPIKQTFVIPGITSTQNNGAFLIDTEAIWGTDLLFIVAHTPCCDNDSGRQQEIDAMMAFIRDSKTGDGPLQLQTNTPIVVAGDMNLVGDAANYETLLTGDIGFNTLYGPDFDPDWDGSELEDALPVTTGSPFTYSWINDFGSFFPGRLDVVFYSGSVVELTNTYALETAFLSADSLNTHGLLAGDSRASDHLPLIADFKLKEPVNTTAQNIDHLENLTITPNPVKDVLTLNGATLSNARLEIIDVNGRILWSDNVNAIFNNHLIQCQNLPSGKYYLSIKNKQYSKILPFIKI